MNEEITITKEERILFIINDNLISGSVRFQKYGFLLHKQYQKELMEISMSCPTFDFYKDWKPYHYGPYSQELQNDMDKCENNDMLDKKIIPTQRNKSLHTYALTIKGRKRWRGLFLHIPEMREIDQKIKNLQKMPYNELIRRVYNTYPEYTKISKIRESMDL